MSFGFVNSCEDSPRRLSHAGASWPVLFSACWFWHVSYSALELSEYLFTEFSVCLQADVQRCILGCAFRYKGVSSEGGGSTDSR